MRQTSTFSPELAVRSVNVQETVVTPVEVRLASVLYNKLRCLQDPVQETKIAFAPTEEVVASVPVQKTAVTPVEVVSPSWPVQQS